MGAPTRTRYIRRQNTTTVVGMIVGIILVLSILGGLSLGQWLAAGQWETPLAVIVAMVKHEASFYGTHVLGMGAVLVILGAVLGGGWWAWKKLFPAQAWVDPAAQHMASAKDVQSLSEKAATAKAARLGEIVSKFVGLPLGVMVNGGKRLFASLEDVGLIYSGPRTGKTSSFGVPHVLAAPGPVLATENKRGLHDHTRGVRELVGKCFAFDPQGIVGEDPLWWWNPLAPVTDETKAYDLAEVFAKAEMESVSSSANGNFFEQRATTLLRGLFLAAAVSQGQALKTGDSYVGPKYWLRDVQGWIAAPDAEEPIALEILAGTVYREVLNELVGIYSSAPQERSGVFSTVQVMTSSLSNLQIARWVNPAPGDENGQGRTHFEPLLFLAGANTLYSLSKDGSGSAKALVTALTVAVCDAAEQKAAQLRGGRLTVPLVVVLDEAANVCRWPKLPKLYSHYGSRGILIVTILQSYPQGEGVWGKAGMDSLMEAANWVAYAGGNKPGHLLSLFSDAIGDYYYSTPGSPGSRNSPGGPRQEHKDKIFDAAELAALPRGRAVLLSSGNRAALLRTVPWMATPHKTAVEASLLKYDPQAEDTIRDAGRALDEARRNPDAMAGAAV
jgi:TraM recognition site of TraD and TraG/Type IV secretory system Conjugative DNA transfer